MGEENLNGSVNNGQIREVPTAKGLETLIPNLNAGEQPNLSLGKTIREMLNLKSGCRDLRLVVYDLRRHTQGAVGRTDSID